MDLSAKRGADVIVRNIASLATLAGPVPRTGAALRDLGLVTRGALAAERGRLVFVGQERELEGAVSVSADAQTIDAEGGAVVPGFVDPHTHLVFAGDRDDELRRRLAGVPYAQIAAEGGGIVRSVAATRAASTHELTAGLLCRLDELLRNGTTTAEVKSGYGLETAAELCCLEAIRDANAAHPIGVVATFLGAHEVPLEHRDKRERYVEIVIHEMIPEVARRGLARFCDVFCEEGVFSVVESRLILDAAKAAGLGLRLHADELANSGGTRLAAELGARSADHLIHANETDCRALARVSCAATLLPAAAFYLKLGRYAPARTLIDAGAAVALATDANPGGGLSPSMAFAMTVACFGMGMALEEALAAATINAAFSLDVQDDVGSLEVGKRADFLILRSPRLLDLLRVGSAPLRSVVKDGFIVVKDGTLVTEDWRSDVGPALLS